MKSPVLHNTHEANAVHRALIITCYYCATVSERSIIKQELLEQLGCLAFEMMYHICMVVIRLVNPWRSHFHVCSVASPEQTDIYYGQHLTHVKCAKSSEGVKI